MNATTTPALTSIRDVFAMRPAVFAPLMDFAEQVMRSPGALTQGERELIAAMTSHMNLCAFCFQSHRAVADYLNGEGSTDAALHDFGTGTPARQYRHTALLALISAMRGVRPIPAWVEGHLTPDEIHDAVTVIAAFNLFNRLVGAYDIPAASDEANRETGKYLATVGYAAPRPVEVAS